MSKANFSRIRLIISLALFPVLCHIYYKDSFTM